MVTVLGRICRSRRLWVLMAAAVLLGAALAQARELVAEGGAVACPPAKKHSTRQTKSTLESVGCSSADLLALAPATAARRAAAAHPPLPAHPATAVHSNVVADWRPPRYGDHNHSSSSSTSTTTSSSTASSSSTTSSSSDHHDILDDDLILDHELHADDPVLERRLLV